MCQNLKHSNVVKLVFLSSFAWRPIHKLERERKTETHLITWDAITFPCNEIRSDILPNTADLDLPANSITIINRRRGKYCHSSLRTTFSWHMKSKKVSHKNSRIPFGGISAPCVSVSYEFADCSPLNFPVKPSMTLMRAVSLSLSLSVSRIQIRSEC